MQKLYFQIHPWPSLNVNDTMNFKQKQSVTLRPCRIVLDITEETFIYKSIVCQYHPIEMTGGYRPY